MTHLFGSYIKGVALATASSSVDARSAIVAVIVALVLALVAWVIFHVIAPPYEAVAAIIVFLLVLVVLLFL